MAARKNQQFTNTLAGDETQAILIVYVGTGTATVVLSDTGGVLTFTDDETSAVLPDDATSTAGTLTLSVATVDTMGELADIINASTNFITILVATLRSAASDNLMTDASFTGMVDGNSATFVWDTGLTLQGRVCLGPESDTSLVGLARQSTETVGRKEPLEGAGATGIAGRDRENRGLSSARVHRVTHNTRDADVYTDSHVEVYSSSQTADRLLFRDAGRVLAATNGEPATEVDWSNVPIESDPGERLVIITVAGGTVDAMEVSVVGAYGGPGGADTA